MKQKPILYNSYLLSNGSIIRAFKERLHFVEVYELTDGNFYFLFLRITEGDIVGDQSSFGLLIEEVDGKTYFGTMRNLFSPSMVRHLIETLTARRGLNAVAGMDSLKSILQNDIISIIRNPEKFKKFKLSIPNGMLLFGPPGCGKTFIVKKFAEELNHNYIELKHSDVASPYIHGTVGILGKVFEAARQSAPSVVFIDEIEGLVPKREGLSDASSYKREEVNEFLLQLNDAGKHRVFVVAATNRPDLIDTAILRAGRMDKRIFVPPPDKEARKSLFVLFLEGRPVAGDININDLAQCTELYAASDIELVVNESARFALLNNADFITQRHLLDIIERCPPSLTREMVADYQAFLSLERW